MLKFFVLKTKRGQGAEFPATGGQWGFGGGVPDATAILQLFSKKIRIFRHSLVKISRF